MADFNISVSMTTLWPDPDFALSFLNSSHFICSEIVAVISVMSQSCPKFCPFLFLEVQGHLAKGQRTLAGDGMSQVTKNLLDLTQRRNFYAGDLLSSVEILRNVTETFKRASYEPSSDDVQVSETGRKWSLFSHGGRASWERKTLHILNSTRAETQSPRLWSIRRSPPRPKRFHLIKLGLAAVLILFMSIGWWRLYLKLLLLLYQ